MTVANEHTLGPQYSNAVRALEWAAECPKVLLSDVAPPAVEIPDFIRRRHPQALPRPGAQELRRRLEALHRQVTRRDELLLHALAHHRVLTTDQIAAAAFSSVTTARHRLAKLHQLGLIRSFRRRTAGHGMGPSHCQLGLLGAGWIASHCASRAVHGWRADRAASAQASSHLRHLVGLNQLIISQAAVARSRHDAALTRWWSEVDCDTWCGETVQPDARIEWTERGRRIEALVEYDRGTESHRRLRDKLDRYAQLERDRGVACWVLLAFTSSRRESAVRRSLIGARVDVPVATTVALDDAAFTEPLWTPLGSATPHRLIALADQPLPNASLERARHAHRPWRYRESTDRKEMPIGPIDAD